jgi:putative ABC transport system permease protein
MFYLRYLRAELLRRKGRTILTLAGLALGVGLVIAMSSLSNGLDHAQRSTLDPLSGIGTDLTVTRAAQQETGFGFGPGGGGGARDLVEANQSAVTDLSKLGKPGTHFVHDFFLPGTQLTFGQSLARQIGSLADVATVSSGLLLQGVHQEGKVPTIVARIKTGGRRFDVTRAIKPPTAAEIAKIQTCIAKLRGSGGAATPTPGLGGARGGGAGPGGGVRFGAGDRAQFAKCLPARMRRFSTSFTTPRETLQQVLNPPQTDIQSRSYTVAGVDTTNRTTGLVTAAQLAKGRFLTAGRDALVSTAYASRHSLKVGSKLDLNGTTFTVVGLVTPPLGGEGADVYLPLGQLQALSGQKGLVNVVLVRASSSSAVPAVERRIESAYSEAQVASSKQVASTISGSLVDAKNLSHDLGLVLSVLAAVTAFLLAALLALSSVGKRVRELGTLKALGWTQGSVVRQVAGESVATGVAGGILGVVLGLLAAVLVDAVGPTLTASSTSGGGSLFGIEQAARTTSRAVSLTAPVDPGILLLGFALALVGGLLAGAAGALRAARLRPADALRTVE